MRRKRVVVFALVAWLTVLAAAASAEAARYVVVYDRQDVPANAAERMAQAGGRLLAKYDRIGVAVAESENEFFRAAVLRDPRVAATSATDPVGVGEGDSAGESMPGDLPNAPATDADTFSALQWNMRKIQAPEAHAITGGSPSVVVGVIDTGLDATHPDLDGNVDAANSVSCVGRVPDQSPAACRPSVR